jgi:arsenate reductase
MITIYHNPRCSKSREALERAQQFAAQQAIELSVIDYQKTPLTTSQLRALYQTLKTTSNVEVRSMVRAGEDIYATLNLANADDATLFDAIAAHPILLQRPIVTLNGRGIIARPPELVDQVLIAP